MMRDLLIIFKRTLLLSIGLISLCGCVEKSNISRQFEKLTNAQVLSADGKEITINIRSYYLFVSKEDTPFDEKGYFINEKENSDYLIEPIVRSASRSIIGKYNPLELSLKNKEELKNEIFDSINSIIILSNEKSEIDIQINNIILEEILFSESAKQSILKE